MSKPPVEGTFLSSFSSPAAIRNFSCQVIFLSPRSHWISTSQCCEVDFCGETPAAGEVRNKLRGDCQRKGICSLIYVRLGKVRERSDLLHRSLDFKWPQILAWSSARRRITFQKFLTGSWGFFYSKPHHTFGVSGGHEERDGGSQTCIEFRPKSTAVCSISNSPEDRFLHILRSGKKISQTFQTIRTLLHALTNKAIA